MTAHIHTAGAVCVATSEPCPADYDAVVVLPFHPVYGRVRAEHARSAGRLTDRLNAMWRECWRDQQTVDGAPAVVVVDGSRSVTVMVRGELKYRNAESLAVLAAWLSEEPAARRVLVCGIAPLRMAMGVAQVIAYMGRSAAVAARWCAPQEWYG